VPQPYSPTLKKTAASSTGHTSPAMQQPGLPLGSQSANAAYSGMKMPVKYLPTPMVTMPAPLRPPVPPAPQMPNPPQPTAYQNAFTPPEPPKGAKDNYHNPMMGMMPPPGYGMGQPGMMPPPGYGMGQPGMMPPPGYGMGQPGMMPPPGYGMGQPGMMPPPGYGMAPPPMMAQGFPQGQPGSPSFPVNVARNYQGPTPPSPFGPQQPVVPVMYQQPPPPPYMGYPPPQTQYANPAMDRPGIPATPASLQVSEEDGVYQLLTTLKTSLYPAQREWAAIHLAKYDWRNQSHLIQGLLAGAKEDPAATVRIACIKSLVRLGVNREVYRPTLESMGQDIDPRVRQAVEEALSGTTPAQIAPDGLIPVGLKERQ
jgi:hypothetical protein